MLDKIVGNWRDGVFSVGSLNRRSAACLVDKLSSALKNMRREPVEAVHLLVVGIEVSLYVSEQFAADVCEFVHGVSATAVSANQLVGGDKVYFSSRDSKGSLSLSNLCEKHTVVLIVSQSGQTFPSLKATARLCQRLSDKVFVLVGGSEEGAIHTEMGSIVMQHHREKLRRNGSDHIFCNLSGFRPCEPSSVAVVATHQTLTELLIFTNLRLSVSDGGAAVSGAASGGGDSQEDSGATGAQAKKVASESKGGQHHKEVFKSAVVALTMPCLANIARIVGCDAHGQTTLGGQRVDAALKRGRLRLLPSPGSRGDDVHEELVAIGRRWGKHISEAWRVMFLSGAYILLTVVFGVPIFRVLLNLCHMFIPDSWWAVDEDDACWAGVSGYVWHGENMSCKWLPVTLGTIVAVLDALVYIKIPVFFGRLLRWLEGRPLYHRFGKRTIVVADTPWVGMCTEQYASKLWALAYGFASPDVHSADPVDDLIHRFGHRCVRGLLVAFGRPDGRLFAFTKTEAAVLLATKQVIFKQSLEK